MMVRSCFVPKVCSLLHLSTKRVFCHERQWGHSKGGDVQVSSTALHLLLYNPLSFQNHSELISRARAEIVQFQPVAKTWCQADTGFAEDFVRCQ